MIYFIVAPRQVLYHLRHSTSLFCCGYFWDGVSLYADLDHDPPIYASLCGYMPLWLAIGWDRVSQTFSLGWILPISASQVARIIGLNHRAKPQLCLFLNMLYVVNSHTTLNVPISSKYAICKKDSWHSLFKSIVKSKSTKQCMHMWINE
jgi:hypothetical protein